VPVIITPATVTNEAELALPDASPPSRATPIEPLQAPNIRRHDPYARPLPDPKVNEEAEPSHDPDDEPEDFDDLVDFWSAAPGTFPEDALRPFRSGNGASLPAVAALRGSDLVALLKQPTPPMPRLAAEGLVATTRAEHLRTLRLLSDMPPRLQNLPLSAAIITFVTSLASSRRWRHTTRLKKLATAQGALTLLPLYRTAPAITLSTCPTWRQAMRAAGIKAREELPRQPKPATAAEVTQAIAKEPSLPTAAAIIVAWHTAARVGCVLQLDAEDVLLNSDRSISVRFRRGKSVRARGPYTVHTGPLPRQHFDRLLRWHARRRHSLFKTSTTGAEVRTALRRINPELEQRSLRRGSLQALAQSPNITDEVLMLFSGHTQVSTLRRYLSWGVAARHTQKVMSAHAPAITLAH